MSPTKFRYTIENGNNKLKKHQIVYKNSITNSKLPTTWYNLLSNRYVLKPKY